MLVLSGKHGSKITIGKDIEITLLDNSRYPGYYRVGIKAPCEVPIIRDNAKNKQPKNSTIPEG